MNPKDIEILRKRQSESADRLDRSWMPEKGQRVLRGGNIHYAISDRVRAVDCGGLGVIQLLVKQLELAETIDQRVKVLERHLPYRESDHVLNLIYNVMTGGSCLQDRGGSTPGPGVSGRAGGPQGAGAVHGGGLPAALRQEFDLGSDGSGQ